VDRFTVQERTSAKVGGKAIFTHGGKRKRRAAAKDIAADAIP